MEAEGIVWDNQIKWKWKELNGQVTEVPEGAIISVATWNVMDCTKKKWKTDPPVILRNIMLSAAHPNRRYAIGEVPTTAKNPNLLNPFKYKGVEFKLDLASGARTHGRFTFNNEPVGASYYGEAEEEQWKRIIYGSILHTACKNILYTTLKILIIDDEEDETDPEGYLTGDSHAKCTKNLLLSLRAAVNPDMEPGLLNPERPVQFRLAIAKTLVGKGTVAHSEKVDASPYDLVLPISCLKGKKLPVGAKVTKRVYIGIVFEAEQRRAKPGWMFFQWFSFETLEQDGIISRMEDKCEQLATAYNDIAVLAELLRIDGAEEEEEEIVEDNGIESEVEYVDNMIKIVRADKNGLLITHPWIVSRITDRLRTMWLNLAKAAGVRFHSVMTQPDESLAHYHTVNPDGSITGQKVFCAPNYPEGEYIMFINPMRHWGDTQLWENKHEGSYANATGVLAAPRLLLLSLGRDTDGDFVQMIESSEYPAMREAIANFSDSPNVEKLPKVALSGNLRSIALRSMNDKTGIVASLLGRARAANAENIVMLIPAGGGQEQDKEMRVIDFLSQQLQIAVDSLKSAYPNNDAGLTAVRQLLDGMEAQVPWLKGFKDPEVYKSKKCPVSPNAVDTISRLVRKVNSYWVPADLEASATVSAFHDTLYGEDSGIEPDDNQINIANEIRVLYGVEMSQAIKWKDNNEGDTTRIRQVTAKFRELKNDILELLNPDTDEPYEPQTWAAAFWRSSHKSEDPRSKAGAVFTMFTDELSKHLMEIEEREEPKILTAYGVQHGEWAAPKDSPLWNGELVHIKPATRRVGQKVYSSLEMEWPNAPTRKGYHHLGILAGKRKLKLGVMRPMKIYSTKWRNGVASVVMLFDPSMRQEEIMRMLSSGT